MTLVKYTEIFHPNELSAVSQEKRAVASATATATASAPATRFVIMDVRRFLSKGGKIFQRVGL